MEVSRNEGNAPNVTRPRTRSLRAGSYGMRSKHSETPQRSFRWIAEYACDLLSYATDVPVAQQTTLAFQFTQWRASTSAPDSDVIMRPAPMLHRVPGTGFTAVRCSN